MGGFHDRESTGGWQFGGKCFVHIGEPWYPNLIQESANYRKLRDLTDSLMASISNLVQQSKETAQSYYLWLTQLVIDKYQSLLISDQAKDNFFKEVSKIYSKVPKNKLRLREEIINLKTAFTNYGSENIKNELETAEKRLAEKEAERKIKSQYSKLLLKGKIMLVTGKTQELDSFIRKELDKIDVSVADDVLEQPYNMEDYYQAMARSVSELRVDR